MSLPEIPRWPKRSILWDPDEEERAFQQLNDSRRARGLEPFGRELLGERREDDDMAPIIENDKAPPGMPEKPQPSQKKPGEQGILLHEIGAPESMTDAEEEPTKAGDQLANKKVLEKNNVRFRAFFKNDTGAHGARQEHARHGPDETYHLHLYDHKGTPGPRISTETFLPLKEDRALFTGEFKKAVEGLSEHEKRYLYKANREVFHTGNLPPGLVLKFGLKGIRLPRGQD